MSIFSFLVHISPCLSHTFHSKPSVREKMQELFLTNEQALKRFLPANCSLLRVSIGGRVGFRSSFRVRVAGFEINFRAQLSVGQPQVMFWLPHRIFWLPHTSLRRVS